MTLLVLLGVYVGLFLFLAVLTVFLQGYFEESPPELPQILQRAALAALLVDLFFGLWCFLASKNPDRWAALTEFNHSRDEEYFPQLKAKVNGQVRTYIKGKDVQGRPVYRLGIVGTEELPARPEEIVVQEGETETTFKPDRGKDGKFKLDYGSRLKYRDDKGRVMEEGYLGQVTTTHTSWLITYLLLNLLHVGVWLAATWPILRFTFWQAFTFTAVAVGVVVLFVIPPLLRVAAPIQTSSREPVRELLQERYLCRYSCVPFGNRLVGESDAARSPKLTAS